MTNQSYDIIIIGGGIIGLATAMTLSQRFPKLRISVLDKEKKLAQHQTGHNSGVIHSGIYYKPGSLKAINCIEGSRRLLTFCDENNIPYKMCGKVIVATSESELPALAELHRRGIANGVAGLEIIEADKLKDIEPYASGIKALLSPKTGIIDYVQVSLGYAKLFREQGGDIHTDTKVNSVARQDGLLNIETNNGLFKASFVINCAGLYSDVIARMMGDTNDIRIIPFRGEYYMLSEEAEDMVQGLIYPVPDPAFPFLGVHFTNTIHGKVEAGPNAVFAFAREGYSKTKINISETFDTLKFSGFWNMTAKYWSRGIQEFYRSLSKKAFVHSLQKLIPAIEEKHLAKGGSGVRAQEVTSDGFMQDDFHITETPQAIHVRNAPSPGATASLSISNGIVDTAVKAFRLD
jgi:L-2-hydroxyglutarate oxidase LhgO